MISYNEFIKNELPVDRQVVAGDFVSITTLKGGTIEGKLFILSDEYIVLEVFTGNNSPKDNKELKEFAKNNGGYIIDYSIFPTAQITSLTRNIKLIEDPKDE